MHMQWVILSSCLLVVGADRKRFGSTTIQATDDRLLTVGRFLPEGTSLRCGWSACQISGTFSGSRVEVSITASVKGERLLVMLDGVEVKKFATTPSSTAPYVLDGLAAGTHNFTLMKLTEDNVRQGKNGTMLVNNFTTDGLFLARPMPRPRRILFVGDSDTAGWCADGEPGGHNDPNTCENSWVTWASNIARDLDADMMVCAISGFGVLPSTGAVADNVPRMLPFDDSVMWNSSSWIPDAVIMLIGPNDFNKGTPVFEDFKSAYVGLVDLVQSYAAPPPPVINVCGGSINGLLPCPYIQQVIEYFNLNRKVPTSYATVTNSTWNEINQPANNGCNHHYNPQGHRILADSLLPQVKQILGWIPGEVGAITV